MNKCLKNKRRLNPYLIKKNRAYTFAEVAEVYNKHIRSIQQWRKEGLQVIDESTKPYLVLGIEVRRFLTERNSKSRISLKESEFYCFKCRTAVSSQPNDIKFDFTGKKLGKSCTQVIIKGVCQNCNTSLRRFSTIDKITEISSGVLKLTQHPLVLIDNGAHSLNTDMMEKFNEY